MGLRRHVDGVFDSIRRSIIDGGGLVFARLARACGLFPRRGDVLEVNKDFSIIFRSGPDDDWRVGWMIRGTQWLVLDIHWESGEPINGTPYLPATSGRTTLVGFGRTTGLIEIAWLPGVLEGSRGLVFPWGLMRRLFDRRGS